ncbi:MAG: cryptochrome/photolyase family protein [Alphaproteobacteria bacterium]
MSSTSPQTQAPTAIVWFRQDLRLEDNPALTAAIQNGFRILPVFILDDENAGAWKRGGASRWWLHKSLESLNRSLNDKMIFCVGKADEILPNLVHDNGASAVFWNRCYEPWRIARDTKIKDTLKSGGIDVHTFNASLLWEPWEIKKSDGTPYKVFTPFYRKGCLEHSTPALPVSAPALKDIRFADAAERNLPYAGALDSLALMPSIEWYSEMDTLWQPGESGAHATLEQFLNHGLKGYKEERNRPDKENVSRLSPYLHFGEISPRAVWHRAQTAGLAQGLEKDTDHFCSELGWREFSYSLLYYNPDMMRKPLQTKFENFPWDRNDAALAAWQKGLTGIPIVDAGMRQLWRTGWMHNRVRMIVASVLIKNMLLHWHHGEDWFWDTLIDADLANNAASWQWVAGCGADAAPYFRIFNPITQGEKFDPDGAYIRAFVPELADMPKQYIHKPWEAGPLILREAGVTLGESYPLPIVDLKKSRDAALEAFQSLKTAA